MATIKTLSFDEACELTGRNAVTALRYSKPSTDEEKADNAIKRLEIFIEAYNMVDGKKWIPNYANSNEPKWRIWFVWDRALSAFRFSYTYIACSLADSATGSRHACRTDEIAEHVGTAHLDDWNLWLIKQ